MKFRTIAVLLLTPIAPALAQQGDLASLFPPPPVGYTGTAFRGVALGQSWDEVNTALDANGMRCATAGDLSGATSNNQGIPLANKMLPTCWFVPNSPVLNQVEREQLRAAVTLTEGFWNPYQAVHFVEGRATFMGFSFGYFNAAGMSTYEMASGLVQNYGFPNGMQASGSAYSGLTDRSEKVTVVRWPDFSTVTVSLVGGGSEPTFD